MSSSRFTRPLLLFLFVALLSIVPRAARAEIVHGFLTARPDYPASDIGALPGESFDFDTQTIVRWDSAGADLTIFQQDIFTPRPWFFGAQGAARITRRLAVSLEDLLVAPESGYHGAVVIELGVYVIKTNGGDHGESVFAKFRVHRIAAPWLGHCCFVTIEYYVQLNGSRNLNPLVPVEETTWGRVKALYQ